MRAVYLSNGVIEFIADYAPASIPAQLIAVDVLKAGICETDLQLKQGYMGFAGVPGHEFVGVARSGLYAGQRVVGEINCACGVCSFCKQSMPRHCSCRSVVGILNHDGAFADTVYIPEANLHVVPDKLSTQQAVFTEPVAAACRILEQVRLTVSSSVVIFGDGRLGNLCAQVLNTTGCQLLVVGKHQWKLNHLKALGINTCLLTELADTVPSNSFDIAVDCTGSPSGFESAIASVKPCGTVILKTTVAAAQSVHLAPIVINEINVLGSRCGPFEPALQMLAGGQEQVDAMISAQYPLEDALSAFEHAERPDTLKVLLEVSG